MTTISKDVRAMLRENFFFTSLAVEKEVTSDDNQTTKLLFRTPDSKFVEAVIMRHLS